MFKVSFKENPKFPVKKVQRFKDGKVTIVTLKGVVKLPKFLCYFFPPELFDWMDTCKNIEAEVTMSRMYLTIKGKARRSDNDTENNVLGERIAECRAKVHLYKFMQTLTSKLYVYYCRILSTNTSTETNQGDDTIAGANLKYGNLYSREIAHLKSLLAHESDTESSQKH